MYWGVKLLVYIGVYSCWWEFIVKWLVDLGVYIDQDEVYAHVLCVHVYGMHVLAIQYKWHLTIPIIILPHTNTNRHELLWKEGHVHPQKRALPSR